MAKRKRSLHEFKAEVRYLAGISAVKVQKRMFRMLAKSDNLLRRSQNGSSSIPRKGEYDLYVCLHG